MRGQADAIALAAHYVQGDLMTLFVDTIFEADLSVLNNLPDADGLCSWPVPRTPPLRHSCGRFRRLREKMVEKPKSRIATWR